MTTPTSPERSDLDRKSSAVRDALEHGGLGGLSWHELSPESQERYRDVVRYAEGGQGVSTGEVIATRRIAELEQQVARKAEQVDQIIRDQMEENEAQMQEIAELEAEVAWLRAKPSPEKMARRVLDGESALTEEELALYADFKEPDEDTEESPTPTAPEAREKPNACECSAKEGDCRLKPHTNCGRTPARLVIQPGWLDYLWLCKDCEPTENLVMHGEEEKPPEAEEPAIVQRLRRFCSLPHQGVLTVEAEEIDQILAFIDSRKAAATSSPPTAHSERTPKP